MKAELQIIALAKFCGWKLRWQTNGGGPLLEEKPSGHCWEVWTAPKEWFSTEQGKNYLHDPYGCEQAPPNYAIDLNAIHEVEKAIGIHDPNKKYPRATYIDWLQGKSIWGVAAADIRLEAILRTIGKWEKDES